MLSTLSLCLVFACADMSTENQDAAPETDMDTDTNPHSPLIGNIEVADVARILL